MNDASKRYIRDVRLFLKIYGKSEKTFLQKIMNQIQCFQMEKGKYNYEDIVEEFGTPPEVAESYLKKINERVFYKRIRFQTRIRAFWMILFALIISYSIWCQHLWYAGHMASQMSDTGQEYIYYKNFEEDK